MALCNDFAPAVEIESTGPFAEDHDTAYRSSISSLAMSLSFEHLVTFVELVRAGTFNRAAEEMFVTQPAISQRIRQLERFLRKELVIRRSGTRRVALTRDGLRFYEFSKNVLRDLEELYYTTNDQVVRVVCPFGVRDFISTLFNKILEPCGLTTRIHYSSYCSELENDVLNNRADVAIYPGNVTTKQLCSKPLFCTKLIFIEPNDHRFDICLENESPIRFVSSGRCTPLWKITERWADIV